MSYDFSTILNGRNTGSYKWDAMLKIDPDVPHDIVPLSVADMEFRCAPEIRDGLKSFIDHDIPRYTQAADSYYDALIAWMNRRHDFIVKREEIVHSQGIVNAFFNAVRTFTEPGDGVVVMPPVYYPMFRAITAAERTLIECPLIENQGIYTIDFELFDRLARDESVKILLFCSPHNPVGRVWTTDELRELEKIIVNNDLLLISDEIHFDLIVDGTHTVFQTLSDRLAERCITMTSATKSFNLAGLSVCNTVIRNPDIREKFVKAQNAVAGGVHNALAFKATELAYSRAENWLDALLEVVRGNYRLLKTFFAENIRDITVSPLEGTYLAWFDCRKIANNAAKLEKFMQFEARLFLDEGTMFGTGGELFERINLAAPASVIYDALQRLKKALQQSGASLLS